MILIITHEHKIFTNQRSALLYAVEYSHFEYFKFSDLTSLLRVLSNRAKLKSSDLIDLIEYDGDDLIREIEARLK